MPPLEGNDIHIHPFQTSLKGTSRRVHKIFFGYGDVPSGRVSIFQISVLRNGTDFNTFSIRNGTKFEDFCFRNDVDFQDFGTKYKVGYVFSKNWYKVRWTFSKN